MSKNFELMQQAGLDHQLRVSRKLEEPTLQVASRDGNRKSQIHVNGAPLNLDKVTREESLKLVQRVFLQSGVEPPRTVVFAGINHQNGCSQICAQTADILARNVSGSVCLVEANLRTPALPAFFDTTNHYGLTDALLKEDSIRNYAKQMSVSNLWLLSSGSMPSGSAVVLNSDRMKSRLAELRKEFEFLLIDAPPLSEYSDAVGLAQLADGLVLVLEANSTRREAALRVTENLSAAHVRVLGAVLNKRTFPIPGLLYNRL
jgi:capsular exopolysaccharide synthesis family protein